MYKRIGSLKQLAHFIIPYSFILLVWFNLLVRDPWFKVTYDVFRHSIWINRIISSHHISQTYLPGFHLIISELSIVTGTDMKMIYYFMFLLFISLFMLIGYVLIKRFTKIETKALFFPYAVALFISIPYGVPFSMICYFLFPFLILGVLRYMESHRNIELILLFIFMFIASWTHQFSLMFLIFILISFMIFLYQKKEKRKMLFKVWVALSTAWISGGIIYGLLKPSINPTAKQSIIFAFEEFFPGLISNEVATQVFLMGVLLYIFLTSSMYLLSIKYLNWKKINLKKVEMVSKDNLYIIFNILIIFAIFFIFAEVLYRMIIVISANIFSLFDPQIPIYAITILLRKIETAIPLLATFSDRTAALIFSLMSLIFLKNYWKKDTWNENTMILLSFIIPIILLPILSVLITLIEAPTIFYMVVNRSYEVSTLILIMMAIIFLARFEHTYKKIHRLGITIVLLSGILLLGSNIVGSLEDPIATKHSLDWLNEKSNLDYKDFHFDTWKGYYYVSEIPKRYNLNIFNIINIKAFLIKDENSRYPLLKINVIDSEKLFYSKKFKWTPEYGAGKHDNVIYENDIVRYYEKWK